MRYVDGTIEQIVETAIRAKALTAKIPAVSSCR
jgi:hypothetical protein